MNSPTIQKVGSNKPVNSKLGRVALSTIVSVFLLLLSTSTASDTCATIEELGTPNLDRFDYSVSMDVDADCEFTLKMSFKHDDTLPVPSNPATQCDPTIMPPVIATDGLPYLAFRWHYAEMSEDIKKVTGIDHLSIDYNSCGHPPDDLWTVPHYDLHIYLNSPEYRTCMTCSQSPDSPTCDPAPGSQTTASGLAFFNVSTIDANGMQPSNMPAGFVNKVHNALPLMGGHAWDPEQEPPSASEWVDPVWLMSTYDDSLHFFEPMIPLTFVTGGSDNEFTEFLSYEGQTIMELPSMYTVEYNAMTTTTTVTLKGSSADNSYCLPDCARGLEDDWTFQYEGLPGKGCGWANSDAEYRCHLAGVKDACAKSCCHIDVDPNPVDPPCGLNDWTFQINGVPGRGCGWVSHNPETRCMEPGAKDNCGMACCNID